MANEAYEKAQEIARPLTSRSDWAAKTWGGLHMSVQTLKGRCEKPKCFKRLGHEGDCYPK